MKQHMMMEVYDVNNIIWPMPTSTFSDSVISLSHSRLETRTEVNGASPASAKPHLSSYKHATAAVLVRPCLEAAAHTFREHRSVCMCAGQTPACSDTRPSPLLCLCCAAAFTKTHTQHQRTDWLHYRYLHLLVCVCECV